MEGTWDLFTAADRAGVCVCVYVCVCVGGGGGGGVQVYADCII